MDSVKITAAANTQALLLDPDPGYPFAGLVQNHLTEHVWISKASNPTLGPPSLCVPKANAAGPGEYRFDYPSYSETWYYKTAASGDFTVAYWPAG